MSSVLLSPRQRAVDMKPDEMRTPGLAIVLAFIGRRNPALRQPSTQDART
jgi:hypothetical protein